MSQQAIVTLTAITPGIVPPKRVLKLNPDCLCVPIGRASKSISKGLVSAEDNAWFDNPVMSRHHAELVFDPDDVTILIKDTKSMHGTMLNDQKVSIDTLQQVNTGDIVSFGTEVRRGPDTFPPCCFKLSHEFVAWTSVETPSTNLQDSADNRAGSRGFQFPDSSDIEDDQDLFEEGNISQEGDVTPVESPVPKISTAPDAINLTKDNSGPPDAAMQTSTAEMLAGPKEVVSSMAQTADSQSAGRIENPINLDDVSSDEEDEDEDDLEDEDEVDESESEQQDDEESDEESEEDSDKENYDESSDEADDVVEPIYDSDSSNARPEEDSQAAYVGFDSQNETHHITPHMFYDNKDIPISSMRSTVARFSDANTQVDTQNQSCYQGATGADTWAKVFVNGHPEHEPALLPSPPSIALNSSQPVAADGVGVGVDNGNVPQLRSCMTTGSLVGSTLGLNDATQSIPRQPSPSDAAMAKSFKNGTPLAPLSNFSPVEDLANPVYTDTVTSNNWNQTKAQSLGERTGKHEFFQAREINRVRAHEEETRIREQRDKPGEGMKPYFSQFSHQFTPSPNAPVSSNFSNQAYYQHTPSYTLHGSLCPPALPHQQSAHQQQMMYQQSVAQKQMLCQQQMQRLAAQRQMRMVAQQRFLASGNGFGDVTPQTLPNSEPQISLERPARPTTPELDMTSAVKFNQSKLLINVKRASSQPSRSSVRIDDIVERSAVEPAVKSLKRKASEISEVVEEEVRAWAAKDSSVAAENLTPSPDEHVAGTSTPKTRDDPLPSDAATLAQHTPGQPATKRLKRFTENVAYFALGGIALSAGLFSVLVNTAPDFLDA